VNETAANAPITLEQLVALNDEMAAFARAGIPMQRGLLLVGNDLPGRLGEIATKLSRRLDTGESLGTAVVQPDVNFPPLYAAVIEAGIRCGNLSAALEGISSTAKRALQMRHVLTLALIPSLIVLSLAYGLMVFSLSNNIPDLINFSIDAKLSVGLMLKTMLVLGETAFYWAPWPPLVVLLLIIVWGFRSSSASMASNDQVNRWLGWLPSIARLFRVSRLSAFADLLALLVEHHVPLDQATVLAAEACGDRHLRSDARNLAEQIRRGQSPNPKTATREGIPPLLAWLIFGGVKPQSLVEALRRSANEYRTQAGRRAAWLTFSLPILFSAGLGGTATVIYACLVIGPWYKILYEIGQPF